MAMMSITKEDYRAFNWMAKITFLFEITCLLAELHKHNCPERSGGFKMTHYD